MTSDLANLDRDRIRELFDLRSSANAFSGGSFADDPNPAWHLLRETGPVHVGLVHQLTGCEQAWFWGCEAPERPHFAAFSYAACDQAFRDNELFASSADVETGAGAGGEVSVASSMLQMGGSEHRRYRALVQPSFIPAKAKWWMERWITETVQALIDGFIDEGHADLNVDFCAAIPMLTITGSFGIAVDDALDLRHALRADNVDGPAEFIRLLSPVVAARREQPADDLISVLVEAELTDEEGTHRLTDHEIYSFAYLILAAGSGTTWKQMGITLAALLSRPEVLAAVIADRSLLKPAIEESLRWAPTDPAFPRFVRQDVDFHGVHLPKGSILQLCLAAANRDPARWDRPDEYDPRRKLQPSLAFGGGPHVCLGMHVARAEMVVGIGALLDRLPNLRLDPDAPAPQIIGLYERGATELPVLFG